jgi:hypothetical protein
MSAALDTSTDLPPSLPRSAAAFLVSLGLHLAACLTGVLVWLQQPPPSRGIVEAGRQVEVILARADAAERTDYFQEGATPAEAPSENVPETTASTSTPPDSLPAADAPPPSSAALPNLAEAAGALPSRDEGLFILGSGGPGRVKVLPGIDDAAILAEDAARRKPSGPTGPAAQMSLFGSGQARGRSFVFVIDRSQSMGSDGLGVLSAAAKELAVSLKTLTEQQSFQIVAYNQQPAYLGSRRLLPASEENKRKLIQYVGELVAYGATEHYFALSSALQMKPDVIFFLTDGEDPLLTRSQIAELSNRGRTTIHCIQFGTSADAPPENHFMRQLAEQTRGSYVYVHVAR